VETQVRTPQSIFMQPQRLIVPLFQRPYVWSRETQWAPLWDDVRRLAERILSHPGMKHPPHFMGAIVLQQVQAPTGSLQERTVIDGQQRLTTLQVLLDALHAELLGVEAIQPAKRLEALVTNDAAFCEHPEDRHKVWPTNRDRPAFHAVMAASPPIAYDQLPQRGERLVQAHRYFAEAAREWLRAGGSPEDALQRANALEKAVRELLQLVVIDLAPDENAQEIFETLNARGSQLTAADLIKNFIFQRLVGEGVAVESAYEKYWREFETAFWEAEVSAGRIRYTRSSMFLTHWLVARTGEEIVAREVFARFKQYAAHEAQRPMLQLLQEIHRAAAVYRRFIEDSQARSGPLDRRGLFAYRVGTMESEVMKPLVLHLLDPELPPIPEAQLHKAFDVVESWLVRRMLVRATTKSYTQVVAELVALLARGPREKAGELLEQFFRSQRGASRYWPDDGEVTESLAVLPAYRRLSRARVRMVLEAIEDHLRGWHGGAQGMGGERVARGVLAIEHVLPCKWQLHWPLEGDTTEGERERLIHTIGNLTLLTSRLNSSVSNRPWAPADGEGKRAVLESNDVLMLNRRLLQTASSVWTDASIRERTKMLTTLILQIWPVPAGHRSDSGVEPSLATRSVDILDLISAALLEPGATLYLRRGRYENRSVTVLQDGQIDVDGKTYQTPSGAASAIAGTACNGWHFFTVDPERKRSLRDLAAEYIEKLGADLELDDADEDDAE